MLPVPDVALGGITRGAENSADVPILVIVIRLGLAEVLREVDPAGLTVRDALGQIDGLDVHAVALPAHVMAVAEAGERSSGWGFAVAAFDGTRQGLLLTDGALEV